VYLASTDTEENRERFKIEPLKIRTLPPRVVQIEIQTMASFINALQQALTTYSEGLKIFPDSIAKKISCEINNEGRGYL
jgi:hypothetical protein